MKGQPSKPAIPQPVEVNSLLEHMKDGHEYESIVPLIPKSGNIVPDFKRAIGEIEAVRKRPLVCYVSNVIGGLPGTSIDFTDDLPFNEMVAKIPSQTKDVDVLVVTPGGLGQQVSRFVSTLRSRFTTVDFILPYMCMSAGTLWVLSGDRIWMDERAFIGPIDPQVRSKSGEMVPAQSILILLDRIKTEGEQAMAQGKQPPWHLIRLIDVMDPRQVGDAISISNYSIQLASDFLKQYKFKNWTAHSTTGIAVTVQERNERAKWVAEKLCDNAYWKSHGHGISRQVATDDLKLLIDHTDKDPALQKAVRRFWALMYYTLEKTQITKLFLSEHYTLIRQAQNAEKKV